MKANIGITEINQQNVASALSRLLADEFLLCMKSRNAHWNVEGKGFHSEHTFFESQYSQLDEIIDDVAERIRSIGHYAPATLKQYLSLTHLTEAIRSENDNLGYIKELLMDHEQIILTIRENITLFVNEYKDHGTSDFITGLMEKHEKMAWMLRSHLV